MKKIVLVGFWISLVLNIIDLGDRLKVWGAIKMLDMRIILEVGLAAIMVISGIIYLREKYREFRKQLQSVLLLIDSAEYGAGGKTNDVAHILWSKTLSARIENFPVTNDTLGPDPIPHTPKVLTVKYKYCGEPHGISIPEGGTLSIP